MRHLVFAFIRVEDWDTKLNKVIITENGHRRIQTLCEELGKSGIVTDTNSIRIFAEDFREDARLHAEELAHLFNLEYLGDNSAVSTFTSGYRGMKAEIDDPEKAQYSVLIFYVVRDGSTFHETIRYWNENASMFGYGTEFYPDAKGIPLGFIIEIRSNPIQWIFENIPRETATE